MIAVRTLLQHGFNFILTPFKNKQLQMLSSFEVRRKVLIQNFFVTDDHELETLN